jgi:hypothetical protein
VGDAVMLSRFAGNAVWKSRGELVSVVRGFGRGAFVALGFRSVSCMLANEY